MGLGDATKKLDTHQMNDFMVTMGRGQVQRCIIASICGIYAGASLHQHLDNLQMALFGGPVQRTESVIIPGNVQQRVKMSDDRHIPPTLPRRNVQHLTHPWFMSCSVSSSQTRTCMAMPSRHHWNMSSIDYVNEPSGQADGNCTRKLA